MVILGLLLMLACAGLAADAVIENDAALNAVLFDHSIAGLTLCTGFTAGSVLGLLFAIGLAMVVGGIGRRARRRRANRAADARVDSTASQPDSNLDDIYPEEPARAPVPAGRHRRGNG